MWKDGDAIDYMGLEWTWYFQTNEEMIQKGTAQGGGRS